MQDAKEEIRSRLAIEDVIGEYVQLKRAGRSLKGLSPFTDERTPSFMVSPEKQIWHDFSSGKGGDIFSFIMLAEGVDFRQALEHLGRKAGVDVAQLSSRGDGRLAKRRERARHALKLASHFFQQMLLKNPAAIEYVTKKRRLNKEMIQAFRIGYAPEGKDALVRALGRKGFSLQELQDAGLTNRFGGDLFRGRMIVALQDSAGEVIGFTGRIIQNDPAAPKYLNTSQTILFDKSRHIFGLSQAKEAIRKTDSVVIVEGNLDVVSSHQVGVENVVATAGTAMTEHHLKVLSRLASRVKLAFDGDAAGLAATERAISLAQAVGVDLEVISLPDDAKDPDELIQKDVAAWRQAIDDARPAVAWVIERYEAKEKMNTAEGKRRFSTAALTLVRLLRDPVEQEHYLQDIARRADISLETLKVKLKQGASPQKKYKHVKTEKQSPEAQSSSAESVDLLFGIAIQQADVRPALAKISADFLPEDAAKLHQYLLQHPDETAQQIENDLQDYEQYVKIVQLKSDNRYLNWSQPMLVDEAERLVKRIITEQREIKKQQLTQQLRKAEATGSEAQAQEIRQKLNVLIKEKV